MDEVVLRIDSLAAGGDGVARDAEGRVVFVPLTAPGDRVRARIEKARARFARGHVVELLEAGPARVEPRCAAFGRCGGCTWQQVDYPAQVEAKRRILQDALARIGGIALDGPPTLLPSPQPYGYRLRTRVQVEGGRVGYLERGSRRLCAVAACPVLLPELEASLASLSEQVPSGDGEWELAWAGGQGRAAPLPGGRGAPRLTLCAAGERIGFSVGVFAQANAPLLDAFVRRVVEVVGAGSRLVELFAGSGLFTLPLARRFASVVAVEEDERAADDLRANLADAGVEHVRVLRRRVERASTELSGPAPDAVLVDPPRTGLSPAALDTVAGLGAERIAYVSCDPATLARDLRAFEARAYGLARVEGFDLFPQTPHIEALALLHAKPAREVPGG